MPSEKATAIVLRVVEFSETSLVVTLFTREFGKLGALAKGGRRPKGPFESALDLLALCRIVFLRKSSDALDLLTEAKLLRRFRPAGRDLSSLYAAYYVAELLSELTDEYDPHPELFDLADETLAALAAGEAVPRRVLRFELGTLRLLGHMPLLDTCVECGRPVETSSGRVAFGQVDGGVLCHGCRVGKKQVASISAGALRTMAQLADMDAQAWQTAEMEPRQFGELRGVLNHYLMNLFGRKPRMQPYLSFGRIILLACLLAVVGGCASVRSASDSGRNHAAEAAQPSAASGVVPASFTQPVSQSPVGQPPMASGSGAATVPPLSPADSDASPNVPGTDKHSGFDLSDLAPENVWKNVKKATGFGPDQKIARASFQEGESLFRERKYTDAAAKFKTAANRWPDSTLEEDALFWEGESQFFTDQYSQSHDTYSNLLKKHENSRYLDTVVAREFAVGQYWEQMYRADPHWPITPNVTDRSRPWFDTFGNAIKAYENVRMYDPTGPLADDSVMATANAYFVKGEYENAAYNYDLLRKEYSDSPFQPQAHVLGLQSKLHVYQGKDYDGVPLNEAEQIARQALTQFGGQLGAEKERVAQTAKQIVEMKAERDWAMAQYYEKKRYYGAARYYYLNVIKNYPLTQYAQKAKARFEEIRDRPDVPPNYLKWLTDLLPSEEK